MWARSVHEIRSTPSPVRRATPRLTPQLGRARLGGSSACIGRVGALAMALGVGVAFLTVPAIAHADATGSAGATASDSSSASTPTRATRAPGRESQASPNTRVGATERTAAPKTAGALSSSPFGSTTAKPRSRAAGAQPTPRIALDTDESARRGNVAPTQPGPADSGAPTSKTATGAAVSAPTAPTPVIPSAGPVSAPDIADAVVAPAPARISPVVTTPAAAAAAEAAPVMSVPRPAQAAPSGALAWLGITPAASGDVPAEVPLAAPLMWAAAAVSRRDLAAKKDQKPSAGATNGEPADPQPAAAASTMPATVAGTAAPVAPVAPAVPAAAAAPAVSAATAAPAPFNPLGSLFRFFIGDGTAENPNAGLLMGNGFSWDAGTCNAGIACTGGNSGLIGDGGAGFNGGPAGRV